MTNAEKIISLLSKRPGLDDDEISSHASIKPRQTVNQICRYLESRGKVKRSRGPRGKILNHLADDIGHSVNRTIQPNPTQSCVRIPEGRKRPIARLERRQVDSRQLDEIASLELSTTLIVIPCSGSKVLAGGAKRGPQITDVLPKSLRHELRTARRNVAEKSKLDESNHLPAWMRYTGFLYQPAQCEIKTALEQGQHIVVLSGGYGLVLASEPIGYYEHVFRYSDWPNEILERVLLHYIQQSEINNVVSFVSASTAYRGFLSRIDWADAGLESTYLVMPEAVAGAQQKTPRAQGEALVALLKGTLSSSFQSSDGLHLEVQRIMCH